MEIDFSLLWEQIQAILNTFITAIPSLIAGTIVLVLFVYASSAIEKLIRRLSMRYREQESLSLALGRLARWVTLILGMLIAMLIVFPDFSVGQLIQLLGISGLAFGIAFRDIFVDFVAGVLILLNEPFRIGDQIVVLDYEGTIEDIETRTTAIRTYDGRRVIIPNSTLFTSVVTVNTAYEYRRIQYDVGIGYGDDIERAQQLALEAVSGVEGVLEDPAPDTLVIELADYSVVIRVRWWIRPPRQIDALDSRNRVLAAIKRRLTENGIDMPFPTHQILFHDQTEETDGDRRHQREGWPVGPGDVPRADRIARALRLKGQDDDLYL